MNNILSIVSHIPATLIHFFKTVFKQPGIKRYTILSILLTLVFSFATFPYENIIYDALKKLEGKAYNSISMSDYSIDINGKFTAGSLTLIDKSNSTYAAQNTAMKLDILPLLLQRHLKTSVSAGNLAIETKKQSISGKPSITINLKLDKKSNIPKDGNITLSFKQVAISGIEIQGFTIPDVLFSSVKGTLDIKEGAMSVKQFTFNGQQLKGNASGSIVFNEKNLALSKLNLNITILSDSEIITNYSMLLSNYLNPSTGNLQIQLDGTLKKPKPKFIK